MKKFKNFFYVFLNEYNFKTEKGIIMGLSISPIRLSSVNNTNNNVSFGMAKFTEEGMRYAVSHQDVYTPFSDPTEFQDAAFFNKKSFFAKAPFAKHMESMIPYKKEADPDKVDDVAQTIVECGATKNGFANARFVKQMLTTKSHLDKMHPAARAKIRGAAQAVLATNWNNPLLSKDETKALARYAYDETKDDGKRILASLDGVVENSDVRGPKRK